MRIAGAALLTTALALSFGACAATRSHKLEYKLATMDGLAPRSEDDEILHPYIYALNVRCGDSDRREVANLAIAARRTLRTRYGVHVTTLYVLREADKTIPIEPERTTPCAEVFSAWTRDRGHAR